MVAAANASHVGSCLSCADVLAVLFTEIMKHDPKQPAWSERDRLVFSKGHAAAALYAVLAERGYLSVSELAEYCKDGSRLTGHASHEVPGVEVSTGSLGHGLAIANGLALADVGDHSNRRTFAILSDGELDEGSTWEAALFAGHHRLSHLTAIVDYNGIQSYGRVSEILELEPLADKWRSFRWEVRDIDGHDHDQIAEALRGSKDKPMVVIAKTVKGKGVSFMEDDLAWHYRAPTGPLLAQALAELGSEE